MLYSYKVAIDSRWRAKARVNPAEAQKSRVSALFAQWQRGLFNSP